MLFASFLLVYLIIANCLENFEKSFAFPHLIFKGAYVNY